MPEAKIAEADLGKLWDEGDRFGYHNAQVLAELGHTQTDKAPVKTKPSASTDELVYTLRISDRATTGELNSLEDARKILERLRGVDITWMPTRTPRQKAAQQRKSWFRKWNVVNGRTR